MTEPSDRRRGEDPGSVLRSILADEHCREVVAYFRSTGTDVATREELAERADALDGPPTDRERAAVRLHHVTLPKLADAGVLEYDPRQGDVRYAGRADLEAWLDELPSRFVVGGEPGAGRRG